MRNSHTWFRSPVIALLLIGSCLLVGSCLIGVLLLHYATSFAQHNTTAVQPPTITIDTGFNNIYRAGYWTPVRVTVVSRETPFSGTLSVASYANDATTDPNDNDISSPWRFTQHISLAKNQQKQFTTYAPHYTNSIITHSFQVTLTDANEKTVAKADSKPGSEVQPGYILLGVLSDNARTQSQLTRVSLPEQTDSTMVSQLTVATLPATETALENFDALILDNFSTRTLSSQQIMALRTWVNQGGTLIVVGGPDWKKTLEPLPDDLNPVKVYGEAILPAQTHLLTFNGSVTSTTITNPDNQIQLRAAERLPVQPAISVASVKSTAAFSNIETMLSSQSIPLIVQAHQGSGIVDYIALDPSGTQLRSWSAASLFWQQVIESDLGDELIVGSGAQSYDAGPGEVLSQGGLISFLEPAMPQGSIAIFALFIAYILLLGPLRAFLLHRQPQLRRHNGRIVLSTLVIGALFMYGTAAYERNSAITNNSVSITRINQDGKMAHTTTYMGIVTPLTGEVNLQIPGANNLAESITRQELASSTALSQQLSGTTPITETSGHDATNLTLQNTGRWSLNTVVTESDNEVQGQLSGRISLQGDRIVGTVINRLATPLNDAYILLPHNFISLGAIAAHSTKSVNMPVQNIMTAPELTLADQMEQAAGLSAQYFPYLHKQQPGNEFDLHMAMLSALSGIGYAYDPCEGSCQTHAITDKGIIYVTGGQIPDPNYKNDNDPLMLTGVPATLIGWTDQKLTAPTSSTTINNTSPRGLHLNFVQMPLNLSYTGKLNFPRDFVTGNIVAIDSYNASEILPGAYSLTTGSVTFSLHIPSEIRSPLSSITVRIPDLISNPNGQGNGSRIEDRSMIEKIYNWRTDSWENMHLNQQNAFVTSDLSTYTGPDKRVLIQISSRNESQIYFGKPQLNVSSNAS